MTLLLACLCLLGAAMAVTRAHADEEPRDAQLAGFVAVAEQQWGVGEGLRVHFATARDGWLPTEPNALAAAAPMGSHAEEFGYDCQIIIADRFWTATPEGRQWLITHEFGHCLGLDHPPAGAEPQVMGLSAITPTAADLAALRAHSPYMHSIRLGSVASD